MALLFIHTANPAQAQVLFETHEYGVICHYQDSVLENGINTGMWQPEEILKVFVGSDIDSIVAQGSSILGSYSAAPGQITFQPVISFSKNMQYFAAFGDSVIHKFSFDTPGHTITELSEIYPTADTLPENLLKIYLEFTGPMREGEVYENVNLKGPDGVMVKDPFVRLEPELWDYANHRITLWIDPGRVKRSLGSRETHGPVIEAGNRYQLIIDSGWRDAEGQSLDQTYHKYFSVNPADRTKPVTGEWQIKTPPARTKDPLTICFHKPMDFSTALNSFMVYHPAGHRLEGQVTLGSMEKFWIFTPDHNWDPGGYRIKVKSILEDLAGNNLNRVFDRDILKDPQTPPEHEYYWIEFKVANGM